MKHYLFLFGLIVLVNNYCFAQLVDDNVFLQGKYLEAVVAPNGSWGNTITVPAVYHTHPGGGGSGYTDPITGTAYTGNGMDFSYDANHDGWTTGHPTGAPCCYYGPYFMPGTPTVGWAMQVNGARSDAFFTNFGYWDANAAVSHLTGTVVSYAHTNGVPGVSEGYMTGVWEGTAGPGGGLHITQANHLDTLASWVTVKVLFKNTTATAMTGLYYWVGGDPDNDEVIAGGSFPTNNRITYQDDTAHRVMVWARPPSLHQDAFVALAARDSRAKALIATNWAPYPAQSPANTLDQVYNGTAAWLGTTYYTAGSMTLDQDIAIGLIFNLGNLPAGDSVSFSFIWAFNDSTAVDSAFNTTPLHAVNTSVAATVQVFPNPSPGWFTIRTGKQKEYSAEVYNMIGEKVYQSGIHSSETKIDLSGRPAGVYILYIRSDDETVVEKLMINN